tara:strand:- start:492 stop:608 length:117 start_codon:yes stop_codon:yes gene_type:complete
MKENKIMEDLQCEMCKALMTQEDHDICDICGDCSEDMF